MTAFAFITAFLSMLVAAEQCMVSIAHDHTPCLPSIPAQATASHQSTGCASLQIVASSCCGPTKKSQYDDSTFDQFM